MPLAQAAFSFLSLPAEALRALTEIRIKKFLFS
jgi:hypothetical protein